MPVPLNYNGNDDNALQQLIADAGVALVHTGNTHKGILALADLAAVTLPGTGNDRWMMEQLAAAMSPAYVFALDDDGTITTALGKPWLETLAPDYMSYSRAMGQGGQGIAAISAQALTNDGSHALVDGSIVVIGEMAITSASALNEFVSQFHGIGALIHVDGTPTGTVNVGFRGTNTMQLVDQYNGVDASSDALVTADLVGMRIGLYIDGSTGQIGFTCSEGGDRGPVTGAIVPSLGRYSPGLWCDDSDADADGDTLAARLYLDAADLQCTYPVGTVDRNGVEV